MKGRVVLLSIVLLVGCTKQEDHLSKESITLVEEIIEEETPVLESIVLEVPYYNQHENHVPLGCEAICLYSALQYFHIDISLNDFLNDLPISEDDPHLGFVGSIYGPRVDGKLPAIYPDALEIYGDQLIECSNLTGKDITELKNALMNNQPVLVWVTTHFTKPVIKEYSFGQAIENTHTVLLVGYDPTGFIYHDSNTEGYLHIDYEAFNAIYSINQMALSVGNK